VTERKAKRKLSDFDFTGEDAHLALVSKGQGGAANGYSTLLLKAASTKDDVTIEKMQSVMIEMELPDFLKKFFYLYDEDAEVLAYLMGYQEVETQSMEDSEMMGKYQKWIKDNMNTFEVMKSLHNSKGDADGEDVIRKLKELDGETFIELLKAQESIESAIDGYSIGRSDTIRKQKSNQSSNKKEEPLMSVEMIEKSVLVDVQKKLEEQQVSLLKANEMIEQFKKEKFENILKQRTLEIKAVVETDENVEAIIKNVGDIEDSKWQAIVGVMKAISSGEHKDDMFNEVGVSKSFADSVEQQDVLARMIKEKYKV